MRTIETLGAKAVNIESFKIENESEADDYLRDLLAKPEYRSMGEVQQRANTYIIDAKLKNYFITKAAEMLKAA